MNPFTIRCGDVPGAGGAHVLSFGGDAGHPVSTLCRAGARSRRRHGAITRPVSSVLVTANFLFSRILDRFPATEGGVAETSLAWGAYELELADHQFERQRLHTEGYDMLPPNCSGGSATSSAGSIRRVKTRHHIGLGSLLWSTNFPQSTSTWPRVGARLHAVSTASPEAERLKYW